MNNKILDVLILKVKSNHSLKISFLKIWDIYHYFMPFILGGITRGLAYFKNSLQSKVIARPGTLGFMGGAFNPGALLYESDILLVAKSQVLPWYKTRKKNRKYYLKGKPIIFFLEKSSLKTKKSYVVTDCIDFPHITDFAIEDFRIFQWKETILLNHSFVTKEETDTFVRQTKVQSALSVLDVNNKKINFLAFPTLDFPIQHFEKNWLYRQHNNQLLLFYSVNPFKILKLDDDKDFSFKTIVDIKVDKFSNPGGFGTLVSFSTNPIDYDETYWFVVIHQIHYKKTGRCYYHWGVLINKNSLLPVKITSKPLFSGMGARGRLPGIRYISSVIKKENEILFFAGEGDIYVTVTPKTIEEINSLWIPI
jgi:hypothetical protein